MHWGKDNWKGILESDAKGYYAYLPAVFVYGDLNFSFLEEIEEKYPAPHIDYDYRAMTNEGVINKYYAGTALSQLPFYLIADSLTSLIDGERDGYSKWYRISVNWAALFYLFLGLFYLRKSLLLWNVPDWAVALLLFATLFGTNLFVYSVVEPGMSHVFSFGWVSLLIYHFGKFQKKPSSARLVFMALILGVIVLIRPINLLLIFALPFLATNAESLLSFFHFGFKRIAIVLIPFLAVVSIQLIIYKISTGSFWVYSYDLETFDFSSPHFFDILFSYKKGLFLYTPLYLLCFLGLVPLWKNNRFRFWSWIGFFVLITYVFSSWWMWFYGGSFSARPYVEYLPLFILLLGVALRDLKSKKTKIAISTAIFLLIVLCQIQSYQYRYYIIHYSEMTKEKYWDVFLKINS
jgi:hypothetical protein